MLGAPEKARERGSDLLMWENLEKQALMILEGVQGGQSNDEKNDWGGGKKKNL